MFIYFHFYELMDSLEITEFPSPNTTQTVDPSQLPGQQYTSLPGASPDVTQPSLSFPPSISHPLNKDF